MKKKFIDLLKSKFKSVGVSSKAFDRVAEYYEKNGQLKEESTDEEIEALAEGAEQLLIMAKSESDSKLEDFKKKNPPAEKPKDDTKKEENKPQEEEAPAWFKSFAEKTEQQFAQIQAGNTSKTRKQLLEDKLKDFPEKLRAKAAKDFERMQFENDEAFNAYVEETVTDFTELNKDFTQESLGGAGKPVVGGATKTAPSDKEIDAIVSTMRI